MIIVRQEGPLEGEYVSFPLQNLLGYVKRMDTSCLVFLVVAVGDVPEARATGETACVLSD